MNVTQGLRRMLQADANGLATIDGNRRHSWRMLGDRVARLAGALQSSGIMAGDRVAVLMLNSDRYIELYLGVAWAGAVIVPTNTRWSIIEIEDSLRDCRPSMLVVDKTFAPIGVRLAKSISSITLVYAEDDVGPTEAKSYEKMIAAAQPIEDAMRKPEDLAGIFYTGGTTGRSKGVMLSHNNLVTNALHSLAEGLFPQGSIYLHAAPMFHLANGAAMFVQLLSGGCNVIIRSFTPEGVMDAVAAERVNISLLVPTLIQMLVDHPAFGSRNMSSLNRVIYGASPITEALLNRAMRKLPHVAFHQLYGMTEVAPCATHLPWRDHAGEGRAKGRHRGCGQAIIGVEVRIVDAERKPVASGTVGEVAIRGSNVMMGYWERPEETAKALVGGWMHTGDGGYMDEDGYFYLVDRIKDMIISGGENVYSIEVENVLAQHSVVVQCAVVGIPDERWGEAVHAIIVRKPGVTVDPAEVIAFCKDKIAHYKCPRSVEVRDDPLPLSGAGKILKRELRRPFWEKKSA
jgi:long-chain acyl-CoA synthetase